VKGELSILFNLSAPDAMAAMTRLGTWCDVEVRSAPAGTEEALKFLA